MPPPSVTEEIYCFLCRQLILRFDRHVLYHYSKVPKITCVFYAYDGLILAKDKEKAERSIEIIREIGGK